MEPEVTTHLILIASSTISSGDFYLFDVSEEVVLRVDPLCRGSDSNGAKSHAKRRFPDSLGVGDLTLELVRDKAGGGSRSCAQIARNEAEVAKRTKLKREPQAVCCPPPDGDEVQVGTRQRECSDQVIARDFLGEAGQPSQLMSLRK